MKIKVYMLKTGDTASEVGFLEIEDTLESKQKLVGGTISRITFGENDEFELIANEEYQGVMNRLWIEDNAVVYCILGDAFIVRNDGNGRYISVLESDKEYFETIFRPAAFKKGTTWGAVERNGEIHTYGTAEDLDEEIIEEPKNFLEQVESLMDKGYSEDEASLVAALNDYDIPLEDIISEDGERLY